MTTDTTGKKDVTKLQRTIVDALEDVKAIDIAVFNTEHLSSLFERVIIASGVSNRQTRALAVNVSTAVRESGAAKPRMEGEDNGEWIIVDCGAAVVHVMQPAIRAYYHLEEIWGDKPVKLKLGAPKPAKQAVTQHVVKAVVAAKPVGKTKAAKPEKTAISDEKKAFVQAPRPLVAAKKVAAKKAAARAPAAKAPTRSTSTRGPVVKAVATKAAAAKAPVARKAPVRAAGSTVGVKRGAATKSAASKPVVVNKLVGAKSAARRPAAKKVATGASPARQSAGRSGSLSKAAVNKAAPRKALPRKSA